MSVEYLNKLEKSKLTDLLFDTGLSFAVAEKKFKDAFSASRYLATIHELRTMCKELVAASDGSSLITALYIVDGLRKADSIPAKVLFYDILLELEQAIRKDMFFVEQIKCQMGKESKEGRKSAEAVHVDGYRIHCAAKVFALDLLAGSVPADEKAITYVSKKQDAIESSLDAWEKNSVDIKEPLSDCLHCWSIDRDKQKGRSLMGCGAVFDHQPNKKSAATLKCAPAKIPSLPIYTGELQYLLPEQTTVVLLDNEPVSSEWETAKRLLDQATKKSISDEDQALLIQSLSGRVSKRIGINADIVNSLTSNNPKVSAMILNELPQSTASTYIQGLLHSEIPHEKVDSVLLQASKSLEQRNVRAFITSRLTPLKGKTSPSEKESFRNHIVVLHEMVTKGSKENKQIYIADTLKSDLEPLIKAAGAADLVDKWEEMSRPVE